MGTMRTIKKRIAHKADKISMKVNLIPLGVAMLGCQLFAVVPEKPGMEPEKIAQRIKSTMAEMQDRACSLTVHDVYEQVGMIQQKENR